MVLCKIPVELTLAQKGRRGTKGLVVSWRCEGWVLGMGRSTGSQSSELCISLSLSSACCCVPHPQEASF